jgi:hypothetical protein
MQSLTITTASNMKELNYPTIDLFNTIDKAEIQSLLGDYRYDKGVFYIMSLTQVLETEDLKTGCPQIYCPEIVEIIDNLRSQGKFVYNSDVEALLPDSPNISWVVYTCQSYAHLREAITTATAQAITLKSQGYEPITDLEANVGKKFLPILSTTHALLGVDGIQKSGDVMVLRKLGETFGLQKPREKRKYRPVVVGQYVKPV